MKLYKTGFSETIKEVESERQTKHSVFINGNRSAWKTNYNEYHTTYEGAKQSIIAKCAQEVANCVGRLRYWNDKLDKANKL